MAFDLSRLEGDHRRWVRTGLDDMEVEIKHVGPREQERFRQKMVADGILKQSAEGIHINRGREEAFFKAYALAYITDWKNVEVGVEKNPPFDPDHMGKVLGQSDQALQSVRKALEDESDFFSASGNGSTG